jgi:hypothetical protein
MAIFTAIGTAIAGALFGGSALAATIIAGVLAFGLQLGISYLTRRNNQKPKPEPYSAVRGEVRYGGKVPAEALFGTGAVKGHRIGYFKWGSGNKFNADVMVLADGWCDGLEDHVYIYGRKRALVSRAIIDNEVAHYGIAGFDNLVSIRFYDGRPDQGVDTKLVSDTAGLGRNWKSTSVVANKTYVVIEREWTANKFDKGRPEITFVLRGLREYDPRKDSTVAGGDGSHRLNDPSTWEHSHNPAWHRLNYQLGIVKGLVSGRTIIGEGKSLGQLDLGSYFAAMNACDALRADGKKTYQCSLWVSADDDHTEVLQEFDDAMCGYGMNRRGLSGVIAGAPQIPVATLTADDISIDRPTTIRHRKRAFERYNTISGQFTSPASQWQPESLNTVKVNADVAADGRVRQTSNDFLQITDADIGQYCLNVRYRQNRLGGSAEVPVSRRLGFRIEEGNWVSYLGKDWLVTGWIADRKLRIRLKLSETSADIYDDESIDPGPVVVEPSVPVNPSLLTTVANFGAEAGLVEGAGGSEVPALRFTWDPPEDPTITAVRFFYQIEGDAKIFEDQSTDPESGEHFTTKDIVSGKVYVARATITTVPDRLKTYTPFVTTATVTNDLKIALRNLQTDVRDLAQTLAVQYQERVVPLIERLARDTAIGTGANNTEVAVVAKQAGATAVALLALNAVVNDPESGLGALAEAMLAVQVDVGNLSAGGLISMKAQIPPPDGVAAQIDILARASDEDDFIQSGFVIQVIQVGGSFESRIVILTDKLIVSDGSEEVLPFVYEDGTLTLENIRLGTLTFDELRSANDKLVIRGSGSNADISVFS